MLFCFNNGWDSDKVEVSIFKLFPERAEVGLRMMANFNDHPDTTFDDILAVLKDAGYA